MRGASSTQSSGSFCCGVDLEGILLGRQPLLELLERTRRIRERYRGKELRCYYPLPRFPSVSVTGARCALNCKHCGGHYLSQMIAIETPEKLKELCAKLNAEGGIGILVSGGCDLRGRVPLERFLKAIRWIKDNTGLIVNVHTGLLERDQAMDIASSGVDIASVDVVGSADTIRRVYGLNATEEDYRKTLFELREAGIPHVVPHICVGLDFGDIRGEAAALGIAREIDPETIVILGLIPTSGTVMESVSPPTEEDVARTVAAARIACPKAAVAIGCMRPKDGRGGIEELAIKAGVDRIVLPSRSCISFAEREGFRIRRLDGCCAIPEILEVSSLRSGLS